MRDKDFLRIFVAYKREKSIVNWTRNPKPQKKSIRKRELKVIISDKIKMTWMKCKWMFSFSSKVT